MKNYSSFKKPHFKSPHTSIFFSCGNDQKNEPTPTLSLQTKLSQTRFLRISCISCGSCCQINAEKELNKSISVLLLIPFGLLFTRRFFASFSTSSLLNTSLYYERLKTKNESHIAARNPFQLNRFKEDVKNRFLLFNSGHASNLFHFIMPIRMMDTTDKRSLYNIQICLFV